MTEHAPAQRVKKGLIRTHPRRSLIVYLLLILASNIVDQVLDSERIYWGNLYADQRNAITVDVDTTGLAVNENPLEYRVIVEGDPDSALPPVLLIHGSPGAAYGFEQLAPLLAKDGRRVLFYDLPGFASQAEPIFTRPSAFEDYSSDSYADITWRILQAMGEHERVHLVGWSNGGAVALRMIEEHPDRVASLTLLASVGAQETEGTGSYAFEHFKYKAGRVLLVHGARFIPHFGVLGPASERNAFLRFFDDTDQRDLGALMSEIRTPTMVMHGRHDFLIADRTAEAHHAMMPEHSRLVMLDAMHFIPMLHPEEASGYLNPFFARHDQPNIAPLTGSIDLAPIPDYQGFDRYLHQTSDWIFDLHWGVQLLCVLLLIRFFPYLGIILSMLFVIMMQVDFAVALLGMFIGRTWWLVRRADILDRPWTILGWVRSILFILPAALIGSIFASLADSHPQRFGIFGFLFAIACGCVVLRFVRLVFTWEGRQRIKAQYRRIVSHEYWPNVILYFPVLFLFTHRRPFRAMARLTALNPGYARDGGVDEDSKSTINTRFADDPAVLELVCIEANTNSDERFALATNTINTNSKLGGYPIIAKPDQGERGFGVAKIRDENELQLYLLAHQETIVLQKYHPGPCELGVLWIRNPESIRDPNLPAPHGSIYAITIKDFPTIVGDNKHSVRQLILKHSRYRCQARMFLGHMKPIQHWIPEENEHIALGVAGSHSQGSMFTDGQHLLTDELEARIDAIARSFQDENGNPFDIGRFDLRCESHEALGRGEFGIVELNGLTSEPSNMYDPARNIFWAWGVLKEYWIRAINLSDARIETDTGDPIGAQAIRKKFLGWVARGIFSGLKPRR